MTIRARFALLLGLLLGSLLLALLALRALTRAEQEEILANDRQNRAQVLTHWINTANRELAHLAHDIAGSDELLTALRKNDPDSVRRLISPEAAGARLAGLWIVRTDGTTALSATNTTEMTPAPPLTPGELARLLAETPSPRFFAEIGRHIVELCARPIRNAAGGHWVVLARTWDDSVTKSLSALTESTVSVRPAHELVRTPDQSGHLVLVRPLADAAGRTLRVLRMDYNIPDAERALQTDWRQTLLFIGFGLLLLAAVTLALRSWVLRPLRVIGEGLTSPTGAPAAPLARDRGEFGRVAQLVLSSAEQRAALEREVAERARAQEALGRSELALRDHIADRTRLGRDLHDGVIQSLYAAGMNLVGIRTHLSPHQTEAAARIEQTSSTLNESIRDLRNFIDGLEPESLKTQTFSQAVGDLIQAMGGTRAFQSAVELDERIASRLTMPQRVHALQITREAVSNALRHGRANRIEVLLRERGGLAEFKIIDNGSGFDAASASSEGRGLLNFTQRARELDAELTLESHPGRGTIVTLTFSLP